MADVVSTAFWNVPNVLTISRVPLTILLCTFIELRLWPAALIVFAVAAVTDWIDGWWARRFQQMSSFGRVFDPLTDKVASTRTRTRMS